MEEPDEPKKEKKSIAQQHLEAMATDRNLDLAKLEVARTTITTSLGRIFNPILPKNKKLRQRMQKKPGLRKKIITAMGKEIFGIVRASGLDRHIVSLLLNRGNDDLDGEESITIFFVQNAMT